MPKLLLRFGINLKRHELSFSEEGPLFHRWLPNNEEDAITLKTSDENYSLKVWFSRYGFTDEGMIRFSYDKKEVDPEIIPKQAVISGGPLIGLLEIKDIPEEAQEVLVENKIGDARYKELGKKVVKIIQPPVSKFIKILRINYGQYWIEELNKWDSRKHTVGTYCNITLKLKWSLDNGKSWAKFIPDQEIIPIKIQFPPIKIFQECLTQEDWAELGKIVQTDYEPGLAGAIYTYSRELIDQGNLKHALIEGVSALEIALGEYVKSRLGSSQDFIKSIETFWALPLNTKIITIATISGLVPSEDLKLAVKAIEIRNKIIHEGFIPFDDKKEEVQGLLRTIAALLPGPRFKFPKLNAGNTMMSLEQWDAELKREQLK